MITSDISLKSVIMHLPWLYAHSVQQGSQSHFRHEPQRVYGFPWVVGKMVKIIIV